MKKLVIFALLVGIFLSFSITASAEVLFDEVVEPEIGGKYYLCATVEGEDYYYRVTNSTLAESVTDTSPYSLYVTSDTTDKNLKEVTLEALGQGFYMGYASGQNIHKIYSADVTNEGIISTGINSTTDMSRHCFFWDANNRQIFAIRGEEKYVLAVKPMKNNKTGAEELHMLSVPASEIAEGAAVAVRFVALHKCTFSDQLSSNEYSHWFPCACGEKNELQMHQVDSWTVTKEAAIGTEGSRTGKCSVCGATAVEGIPALKDKKNTEPTTEEIETEEETQSVAKLDPVVIAVASVLVVFGLAVLIFGKKRDKKQK